MRTVAIRVHNETHLELFVKRLRSGFEVWKVGPIGGRRVILDHHLTHDDLEARLYYSKRGDLVWGNAGRFDLPLQKHLAAAQMENSVNRRRFIDFETGLKQPLVYHLAGTANLIPTERKAFKAAKELIPGCWSDGTAAVSFKPDGQLDLSFSKDKPHQLASHRQIHRCCPDRWNFKGWQLFLSNQKYNAGMRVGVIRVDESELHIWAESSPHGIANVFYRQ